MTTATVVGLPTKREGVRHWLSSFWAMLKWQVIDMRLLLPLTVMVQALTGVGTVIGFGLLIPNMTYEMALFLSTGAVVVSLITVGVVMGPQLIAQQKAADSYDFMWSLPVPRSAATVAWVSINTLIALPGMVGALIAATLRFDISFAVSPIVIPAIALTLVTGTLVGFTLAHVITKPEITQLISGLMIFVIFGFAPIAYPIENLPGWLASVNEFLPFYPMATVVRAGLTEGLAADIGRSYVVLGIWMLASAAVSTFVLRRRK